MASSRFLAFPGVAGLLSHCFDPEGSGGLRLPPDVHSSIGNGDTVRAAGNVCEREGLHRPSVGRSSVEFRTPGSHVPPIYTNSTGASSLLPL